MPEQFNRNDWRIHEASTHIGDVAADVDNLTDQQIADLGTLAEKAVKAWQVGVRLLAERIVGTDTRPFIDMLDPAPEMDIDQLQQDGAQEADPASYIPPLECPVCVGTQRMHIQSDEMGNVPPDVPLIGCGNSWHYYYHE